MKWILWAMIFIAFVSPMYFIAKGIDHLDIMKDRYKRAVDAGTDGAVKQRSYEDSLQILQVSKGYGYGVDDKVNIPLDRNKALFWFYEIFFRNIGIEKDVDKQKEIKKYIPMKAIASFDKLLIADSNDNWIFDSYYEIEYKSEIYRLTLSDKVYRVSTNEWMRDIDFGIMPTKRKQLVSNYIRNSLNVFLNNRSNFESELYYDINIAVSDLDTKTEDIKGINFMVLIEGLPLPSLNTSKNHKFFAFSMGGSQLSR